MSNWAKLMVAAVSAAVCATGAWAASGRIYSIVTCPGDDASRQMRVSWAADSAAGHTQVMLTTEGDEAWSRATLCRPEQHRWCTTYYGIDSKRPDGSNWTEDARFFKCGATLGGLKPDTRYKYRIVGASGDTSATYRFTTAGAREWGACIISDFHTYTPLPNRLESAMDMVQTIDNRYRDVDWVLHIGDVIAWGGSYSFWRKLYGQPAFRRTMWAGLNGNHDNMSRRYELTSNYFRDANYYPPNGYEGERGVCYHFTYGGVLFIMLNSEDMRTPEGLEAAQQWVRKVVKECRTADVRYTVVCEHYQWFHGQTGLTSQYGRWRQLMDECGIDLAIAGNNHIYVRSLPLKADAATTSDKGTTYVQLPSSDNERGQKHFGPLEHNADKIACRWNEGPQTVGAMHLSVTPKRMALQLLDRNGSVIDAFEVSPRRKK
ncbi:MAG: FN3 domain-containing metallophosphoesterase family protein [Sodaliphilus sp.]|nr:FN3 domain-containing metallophosphoesterase family protein [Sodaliphilus sp.]